MADKKPDRVPVVCFACGTEQWPAFETEGALCIVCKTRLKNHRKHLQTVREIAASPARNVQTF
jgi:hypothetical protein